MGKNEFVIVKINVPSIQRLVGQDQPLHNRGTKNDHFCDSEAMMTSKI